MRNESILSLVKGSHVLDVGCAGHAPVPGSPYWLHGRLRERFPGVVGIDINRQKVEQLKAIGYTNLQVMGAEEFQFDMKFDTIVAGELLEHLSNPDRFLRRAKEHLKRDGRIVLTTPYPFSLFQILYSFAKFPKTCSNAEHTCWFCPSTLDELVRRAGFRVEHWELIRDYRPHVPSLPYRVFVKMLQWLGWLLPKRLRCNSMLFVLEVRDDTFTP